MKKIQANRKKINQFILKAKLNFLLKRYESATYNLTQACNYAWFHFPGYVCNPAIEKLLISIGERLIIPDLNKSARKKNNLQPKILHVATTLYNIGGHSKIFNFFIENDTNSYGVLTKGDLMNQSLKITRLSAATYLEKAKELRLMAFDYDFVVLHIHPDDIIPVLAFAKENEGLPPVLFYNHADHCFWVGASIVDELINIREVYLEEDKIRRGIKHVSLLPIPIKVLESNTLFDRTGNDDKINLLSIGGLYKFYPTKYFNFFKSIFKIINLRPNVHIYILGIYPNAELAIEYTHPNIHFIAPNNEFTDILNQCSIYVEGFPFTSLTAMLDAINNGLACQLRLVPTRVNDMKMSIYGKCWEYPKSEADWINSLISLIDSKAKLSENIKYFGNCLKCHDYPIILKKFYTIIQSNHLKKHSVIRKLKVKSNFTELEVEILNQMSLLDN
jgi:hypothetical protein